MAGDQTSHIKITYMNGGFEVTRIYAISEDTLGEAQLWSVADQVIPSRPKTGEQLRDWLKSKGCQLDSCDGPALVMRNTDGVTYEAYLRNGKLHREGGPAIIRRYRSGEVVELFYED